MTYNIYTYNQQLEKKPIKTKKDFLSFFFKKQTHIHTQRRDKGVLIQRHTTNSTQKS